MPSNPESYQAIGWVCIALFALAGGANQIFKLVDRVRGTAPQPPNEQLAASAARLEKCVADLEEEDKIIHARITAERVDEERRASERRQLIYQKIDQSTAATREEINTVRCELAEDINRLEERMDKIPDRVMAQLANIGVFKS